MFSAGYELYDIFVQPNIIAFGICFGIASFCACVARTAMAFDTIDRAGKIGIIMVIPSIVLLINLIIPVHYDYVALLKVNNTQITKITDSGDGEKYTLKKGTSYIVYPNDISHTYAKQKQTTYVFKRSQANLSPIRRLFSGKNIPERVKLEIVKPIHHSN